MALWQSQAWRLLLNYVLRTNNTRHMKRKKKWQYNCREGQADFVKRLLLILKRYIEVKCSNQVGMTAKWGGNFYNLSACLLGYNNKTFPKQTGPCIGSCHTKKPLLAV